MSNLRHYEESVIIPFSAEKVFNFVNDHSNLSSHMGKSSWMMGGGKMETSTDEGKGQKVGSHIKMDGRVFGINLFLDEVVTEYTPPFKKVWQTVGKPKLLVVGNYTMGIEIASQQEKAKLKVFIDYDLPNGGSKVLGYLFGQMYAKWCVRQMLDAAKNNFK